MKLIRLIVGKIILFFDFLFTPTGLTRLPDQQDQVDEETNKIVLYQLNACPFCVKVRRELKRLSLKLELRDINVQEYHRELMEGGKQDQVPCLRIEQSDGQVQWLYESDEIVNYLRLKFSAPA